MKETPVWRTYYHAVPSEHKRLVYLTLELPFGYMAARLFKNVYFYLKNIFVNPKLEVRGMLQE